MRCRAGRKQRTPAMLVNYQLASCDGRSLNWSHR